MLINNVRVHITACFKMTQIVYFSFMRVETLCPERNNKTQNLVQSTLTRSTCSVYFGTVGVPTVSRGLMYFKGQPTSAVRQLLPVGRRYLTLNTLTELSVLYGTHAQKGNELELSII